MTLVVHAPVNCESPQFVHLFFNFVFIPHQLGEPDFIRRQVMSDVVTLRRKGRHLLPPPEHVLVPLLARRGGRSSLASRDVFVQFVAYQLARHSCPPVPQTVPHSAYNTHRPLICPPEAGLLALEAPLQLPPRLFRASGGSQQLRQFFPALRWMSVALCSATAAAASRGGNGAATVPAGNADAHLAGPHFRRAVPVEALEVRGREYPARDPPLHQFPLLGPRFRCELLPVANVFALKKRFPLPRALQVLAPRSSGR
mmetsp:Transcript_3045/g.7067  ORF Transcript_3045/g.7067 Transcript_3045/m.7067 type:complete len:256 (-) Transcript_3045:677-1444(-)